MHSSHHMDGPALRQPSHDLVDCISYTETCPMGLITERVHLLEVQLVSENLIAGFPFHGFVAYFDFPATPAIAAEHLAVRYGVWLPPDPKPVTARRNTSDMKQHARRERPENTF